MPQAVWPFKHLRALEPLRLSIANGAGHNSFQLFTKKKIILGDTREGRARWVRRFERRYMFPPPMTDDPVLYTHKLFRARPRVVFAEQCR